MNTNLFGSFMGSTQKYPLFYIITCNWCGDIWIHTSLGVLWAAHRNIHYFISLHVIGVETDEYIPPWEFYGRHTEISTARWPSSVNTGLGDTQSTNNQIQCLSFSFRERCILTWYYTLMFIPIHVYEKQCSIIKEQILNKICLWNINAPDNSQFQRWLKVRNNLISVERLIVSQGLLMCYYTTLALIFQVIKASLLSFRQNDILTDRNQTPKPVLINEWLLNHVKRNPTVDRKVSEWIVGKLK